jgi:hypothetical protein
VLNGTSWDGCYGVTIIWGVSAWFLMVGLIGLCGIIFDYTTHFYFIFLLLTGYFYLMPADFYFLDNAVANPCLWRVLVFIYELTDSYRGVALF